MYRFFTGPIGYLPHRWAMKAHLTWKLRKAFADKNYSFISSSCLGGLFSQILGAQYRSPTVGLFFTPADYLSFVGNLQRNLELDLVWNKHDSEKFGYPVGNINGINIRLMHYANFEEARFKWNTRKHRVDMEKIVFIFTDRDAATYEHLMAFDRLNFRRKLMFVHKPYPEFSSAIYVKGYEGDGQVGELYSQWHRLNGALTLPFLLKLADQTGSQANG